MVDGDDPLANVVEAEAARMVSRMLGRLSPREERVVRMSFGIGCHALTLEAIGRPMGVDAKRIIQIRSKALRKLRHPSLLRSMRTLPDWIA